jgi:uncharacterized protein YwqG
MNKQELLHALESAGLKRVLPDLQTMLQDSIRLVSQAGKDSLALGATKLGGQPDLPQGVAWPTMESKPMAFVAQVRLEEVAPLAPAGWLPQTGMLSFFYDQDQETYGASPSDRSGWKILYLLDGPAGWSPQPFPDGLAQEARFGACTLRPVSEATLPVSPTQQIAGLKWLPDEIQRYENFVADRPYEQDRTAPRHRMFGYPDQIQDDMQLQSALYAKGYTDLKNPAAAPFLARKTDWKLLLQVDSDSNIGMRWASSGRLFFWIELAALQALAFERAWCVLQAE